jgi:glycosyltransferase involved in cell wall biosynthesis
VYKNKRIAVVMPAYNAESKIAGVIARTPRIYEYFVVVDDKSTDGTLGVLEKTRGIRLLKHAKNRGYGGAQKTLYKEALRLGVDYAVLLHDDGQYDPAEMTKLLDCAIERAADVVLGSRVLGGRMAEGGVPLYKYLGNRALTALENAFFGTSISEFHTGYRVYSRRALELIDWDALTDKYYFDSEVFVQVLAKRLRIAEVPISVHYKENITAANPVTYGMEIVYLLGSYALSRALRRTRR